MSNIFVSYHKFQKKNLKQFFRLIPNIYQYKIDTIILPNSSLYMLPKNKMVMHNFHSLILK